MVSERIKSLREQTNMTQAELARRLGVTRSSVNAWELGISVPSTQSIVELAEIFSVSTDYILCVERTVAANMDGLTAKDMMIVNSLIHHLRNKNQPDHDAV